MKSVTGIYRIIQLSTGESYVGQAIDIYSRYEQHLKTTGGWHDDLREHPEDYALQILKRCEPYMLDYEEERFIEEYNSFYNGFNKTAGGKAGLRPIRLQKDSIQLEKDFQLVYNKEDFTEEEIKQICLDLAKPSITEHYLKEFSLSWEEACSSYLSCGFERTCVKNCEDCLMKPLCPSLEDCSLSCFPNVKITLKPLRIKKDARLTGYIIETEDSKFHIGVDFIILYDTNSAKFFTTPILSENEFAYGNICVRAGSGFRKVHEENYGYFTPTSIEKVRQ